MAHRYARFRVIPAFMPVIAAASIRAGKSSGARGQRFESSRAYHRSHLNEPVPLARVVLNAFRTGPWYAVRTPPGAVIAEFAPLASAATGGPRGCPPRDPPLQRLPPTPRRPAQAAPTPSPFRQGVQEGYAWSFAGTARSMRFSARSARCVTNLAVRVMIRAAA